MNLSLEYKKIKRTGFYPAFLCGGILAALVPVINMAFRSEMYTNQNGSPISILLKANWEMMSMLNILLIVIGTCTLYNTEYANNAIQKMKSLPIRESTIFMEKSILTIFMCIIVLAIEAVSITFCYLHWFREEDSFVIELFKNFGYSFLLILPCIIISLLISSACKNMWISLGIGVVCVFTATIINSDSFILSLFPYAMPFKTFAGTNSSKTIHYIYAAILEFLALNTAELIFIKSKEAI